MSITNITKVIIRPKAEQRAMKMVAIREARQAPSKPKTRARRARKPAMGWRIKA